MRRCRNLAVMLGLLAVGLLVESCSHANQPPPQAAAAPIPPSPPVSTARIPLPPLAHDPALITNERGILAAQRALTELGYNSGEADGVIGPATRRAIQAFQKDHALAEDGRLTIALANMLANLVAQPSKSPSITVAGGDSVIFSDGSVDSAPRERIVQWDHEGERAIVAVRPSTAGWPPAARAGLEWATTHALDESNGPVVQWSSTGVAQHFEIHVSSALSAHETSVAGAGQSCRHYELRSSDPVRHFPAIACKNATGEWYLPHTRIRLARPAIALESQPSH